MEEQGNPKMRFIATLSLNKYAVGKGYGANKKQAKMTAGRMALQGMVPNVYQEWVLSTGRKNALTRLGKNSDEVNEVMERETLQMVAKPQQESSSSQLSSESHSDSEKENLIVL